MGGIKIGDQSLHKKYPITGTPTYTGWAYVKNLLIRVLFVLFMECQLLRLKNAVNICVKGNEAL